jgi:DNA (cytosine-5)-methyltransferase 1
MDAFSYSQVQPIGKFGYSLETFRLSALASLNAQFPETLSSGDQHTANLRLFGVFNEFANKHFGQALSNIASSFCHLDHPLCQACPVSQICDFHKHLSSESVKRGNDGSTLAFADLFCGAGGLSSGFVNAGLRPVCAMDNDPAAILTYSFNHERFSSIRIEATDISEVANSNPSIISESRPDIIVGGPPCQGFSNANRQRLSDDPRNYLYQSFLQVLKNSGANFAVLENVPGMAKAAPSIASEFEELGFAAEFFLLDAFDFGIPQNRKRLFVVAKKASNIFEDKKFFETFKYGLEAQKKQNRPGICSVIDDLPAVRAKDISNSTHIESWEFGFSCWVIKNSETNKSSMIFNHRSKYLNKRDTEIYALLKPGEDTSAQSIEGINPYKDRNHIFKDKFFRLHPDRPSKTITAHMYYDTHMYIHPHQARGLTPREAARIQGFDDSFVFFGYPNEWYRQIGNAVSPVVAQAVGCALHQAVRDPHG